MASALTSVLFGENSAEPPWYQSDSDGKVKMISQNAYDVLERTRGLSGCLSEGGEGVFKIEDSDWAALLHYVSWCEQQGVCFAFRASQIFQDHRYFVKQAENIMRAYSEKHGLP